MKRLDSYTGHNGRHVTHRLDLWREGVSRPAGPSGAELVVTVRELLAADLDTPGALAAIDAWAQTPGTDPDAPALVAAAVDALLGIDVLVMDGDGRISERD